MKVGQEVDHFVSGAHVDTGGRFVEHEEFGITVKSAGQKHPLLLATGEFADVAIFETTEAELLKKFRHSSAFGLGGARPVPLRRPGHQDDFTGRDRKIPVDGFDLGNVGDPQITAAAHRALGWPKISKYQAQKRGLPRPGWAYDPEERRLLDDQVDMIEHERAAVGV